MIAWLFAFGGAAAGIVQAGLLVRAARTAPSPVTLWVRLLLVGGVLLLAAHTRHLAFGALGWVTGFAASSVLFYGKLR